MFETFVLICSVVNPNVCHTLSDTYGPYDNKKQCITRAYEIGAQLPEHMPNYVAVKYKCFKTEDSEGKVRTGYGRDKKENNQTQKHWNEGSYHQGWTQKVY